MGAGCGDVQPAAGDPGLHEPSSSPHRQPVRGPVRRVQGPGPGRPGHRAAGHRARLLHRECGPARHRPVARVLGRDGPVGDQRLRADLRRVAAAGWAGRGPAGPAPHVHGGAGAVRGGVAGRWADPARRAADRLPAGPGRWRGAAVPCDPGAGQHHLRRGPRTDPGHRRVGVGRRQRPVPGRPGRWRAHRAVRLAGSVLRQLPDRRRAAGGGTAGAAGRPAGVGGSAVRPPRRPARHPRRHDHRRHPGPGAHGRVGVDPHPTGSCGRAGAARPVRGRGAAGRVSAAVAAAAANPDPPGWGPGHGGVHVLVRHATVLPHPVSPAGAR
jgi:hypothetical protein